MTVPAGEDRVRRTTSGLDGSRLALVLAVLQRHAGVPLHKRDVFASTVGGARLVDPATDLPLAIALASADSGAPAPAGVVALGEIGLSGELRRVRDLELRLAEAARLGFTTAVVPADAEARSGPHRVRTGRVVDGMSVIEVPDITTALEVLDVHRRGQRPLTAVEDR